MTVQDLLRRLAAQFGELAREDIALALVEMRGKAREVVGALVLAAIAAVFGLLIFVALTGCFIFALALVVPAWLASLIVAVAYAIVAVVLVLLARASVTRALPLYPRDALNTMKEHLRWAKALATSNRT